MNKTKFLLTQSYFLVGEDILENYIMHETFLNYTSIGEQGL